MKLSIDEDTVMIQTNKAGTHPHELETAALTGPSQGSSNLFMLLNFNYKLSKSDSTALFYIIVQQTEKKADVWKSVEKGSS